MDETEKGKEIQMQNNLMRRGLLAELPGWAEIDPKIQNMLEAEAQALHVDLGNIVTSRLDAGYRLSRIQAELAPRRVFNKFLQLANLKRSWANNQMQAAKNAKESGLLPELALKVAASRNMPMLGIDPKQPLGVYTSIVKRNPAPRTEDTHKLNLWLDEIEELRKRRERNEVPKSQQEDPEVLLKMCYRFINVRMRKLPRNSKSRRAFIDKLFGYVLADLGVSSDVSFSPQARPQDFEPVVGRPVKIIEAAA
jgi:hypothetical protein